MLSLLERIARDAESTRSRVYVGYQNGADAPHGLSAGVLLMDGKAHLIQRRPDRKGKMVRAISAGALLKMGGLTGLIEVPVTPAQKRAIANELGGLKGYHLLNAFGRRSDTHNCMGMIYAALARAHEGTATPLPRPKAWQILPGQLARLMRDHLPQARVTGSLDGFLRSRRLPNVNRSTVGWILGKTPARPSASGRR